MKERSYIELLSNRLHAREIAKDPGAAAMSNLQLERSGLPSRPLGDRYSPTSRIGRGRLGEIYEARDAAGRDIGVERRVALQRIDDRIVAEPRFVDELDRGYALLRAGAHPNVVKTLDFFRDGKAYYVVMELLEGLSLRSVLDDAAPEALSLEEAASIVRAVGDGLQYLHAKSMIHGDLRPENVFVTFDYVVKLLDTAPMSPPLGVPYGVEDPAEHAPRGRDVRDDVYGLACLAYELLSGRHPFNANSPHDAHRAGLVAAPLADLPVRQWQAIARGLALQRAQRTSSVAEFLNEFGISGTERLRTQTDSADMPPSQAHVVPPHATAPAPARALTPSTVPYAARDGAAPIHGPRALRAMEADHGPRPRRPRRKTGVGLRSLLLLVLLIGIGASVLLNYDALRASASQLIARVAAARTPQQPTPAAQTASNVESDATGLRLDPTEPPTAAPADDAETNAVTPSEPAPAAEAQPLSEPVERNAVAEPRDAPAPSSPPAPAPLERSGQRIAPSSGGAFRFARPVVTVGEGQAAAAVVIERSAAGAPATIVWWTSDSTATADEDYADLGQRTERFAAAERSRTIFVPLVADALPERTESFFIYLGRYDAARSHLAPSSSLRIDIRDDD